MNLTYDTPLSRRSSRPKHTQTEEHKYSKNDVNLNAHLELNSGENSHVIDRYHKHRSHHWHINKSLFEYVFNLLKYVDRTSTHGNKHPSDDLVSASLAGTFKTYVKI